MLAPQRTSPVYPMAPYGNLIQGTMTFRPKPLDVNWFDTWPIVRSILLGSIMLLSSAAIIGLDIANLAIEGNKNGGTSKFFGVGTAKVGAGIWSGSISFIAGFFIIVTIFVNNKRIAATFALIAVTLAFLFSIVLVGLTANAVQLNQYSNSQLFLTGIQYNLIIAILSLAAFIITLCIAFFIMFISVFFSSSTRRSTKY